MSQDSDLSQSHITGDNHTTLSGSSVKNPESRKRKCLRYQHQISPPFLQSPSYSKPHSNLAAIYLNYDFNRLPLVADWFFHYISSEWKIICFSHCILNILWILPIFFSPPPPSTYWKVFPWSPMILHSNLDWSFIRIAAQLSPWNLLSLDSFLVTWLLSCIILFLGVHLQVNSFEINSKKQTLQVLACMLKKKKENHHFHSNLIVFTWYPSFKVIFP